MCFRFYVTHAAQGFIMEVKETLCVPLRARHSHVRPIAHTLVPRGVPPPLQTNTALRCSGGLVTETCFSHWRSNVPSWNEILFRVLADVHTNVLYLRLTLPPAFSPVHLEFALWSRGWRDLLFNSRFMLIMLFFNSLLAHYLAVGWTPG